MTSAIPTDREHERLISQLPWLVNGTLTRAERNQLKQHIAQCTSCRDEFESLTTINATINDVTVDVPDTNASFARMQQRIAQDKARPTLTNKLRNIAAEFKQLIQPNTTPRWAFAAVCGISAMLFLLQNDNGTQPDTGGTYEVLSSEEQSNSIDVFVQFDDNLSTAQTALLISEIQKQGDFEATQIKANENGFNIAIEQSETEPLSSPAALTELLEHVRSLNGVVDAGLSP